VHRKDDPRLGAAVCPNCYDTEGAVLFNAHLGELWRRTVIATRRQLATLTATPVRQVEARVRLSYVKVAEFQRRGVVHLHALIRLDPTTEHPDASSGPWADTAVLVAAIRGAAATVRAPIPGGSRSARWGGQLDITPLTHPVIPGAGQDAGQDEAGEARRVRRIARYLAKYAVKAAEDLGAPTTRLRHPGQLTGLAEPAASLIATAWELARRPECAPLRLAHHAHDLGYRGHFLTKSRRYSTTFTALRAARASWQATRTTPGADPGSATSDPAAAGTPPADAVITVRDWAYRGRGHATDAEAWLAALAAHHAAQARAAGWFELRTITGTPAQIGASP